jgi:hypothetical protein
MVHANARPIGRVLYNQSATPGHTMRASVANQFSIIDALWGEPTVKG